MLIRFTTRDDHSGSKDATARCHRQCHKLSFQAYTSKSSDHSGPAPNQSTQSEPHVGSTAKNRPSATGVTSLISVLNCSPRFALCQPKTALPSYQSYKARRHTISLKHSTTKHSADFLKPHCRLLDEADATRTTHPVYGLNAAVSQQPQQKLTKKCTFSSFLSVHVVWSMQDRVSINQCIRQSTF